MSGCTLLDISEQEMASDDQGQDGGQPVKRREYIADKLAAVPIVTWDRFVVVDRDGEQVVDVYGWIDREEDAYKDFVWVRFYEDGTWEYTTSSEEYTDYLYQTWFDGERDEHADCRRVEDAFDVENVVELHANASLDAFGEAEDG